MKSSTIDRYWQSAIASAAGRGDGGVFRREKGVGNRKTTLLHQCARNGFLTPYPPSGTLSALRPRQAVIQCRFVFSGKNDTLTLDYFPDTGLLPAESEWVRPDRR